MEVLVYLDTHLVIWLYEGLLEKIPSRTQELLNKCDLVISPMVLLELQYLREIGRITERSEKIFKDLNLRLGLRECDLPFNVVVQSALELDWTRDPFDRMIVAQANVANALLVTKDEKLHKHYKKTVWN